MYEQGITGMKRQKAFALQELSCILWCFGFILLSMKPGKDLLSFCWSPKGLKLRIEPRITVQDRWIRYKAEDFSGFIFKARIRTCKQLHKTSMFVLPKLSVQQDI